MIPSGPKRVRETSEDGFFVHCETSVARSCTQLCVPCWCNLGSNQGQTRRGGQESRRASPLSFEDGIEGFYVFYGVLLPIWMGAVGWNLHRLGRSSGSELVQNAPSPLGVGAAEKKVP